MKVECSCLGIGIDKNSLHWMNVINVCVGILEGYCRPYYSLLLQWERLHLIRDICNLCAFPELANYALKDMISIQVRVLRKLTCHVDPLRLFLISWPILWIP